MSRDMGKAVTADVAVLRHSLEHGAAWTKTQAEQSLGIPERRFRAAVAALRAEGYPVVSWSEEGSTYRKARDRAEVDRFIDTELIPRMRKLEFEARSMRTLSRKWLDMQTSLL